ncbi:MAG: zf-HC2 domain-containing protein [SAR324 cluster bacterium]|nr:zf-HC2 domain-containing protein [SAR324 cluster bacterium]
MNCEETARRISLSLDNELPWIQRLLLKMHFYMCAACRESARQVQDLHDAFRQMSHPFEQNESIHLPLSFKQHIVDELKKHQ